MKKILFILIILFELYIIFYSKEIIKEFSLTLNLCLYSLMPSMFFQIFFSNVLMDIDINIMPNRICDFFNISKKEGFIILLSIFSGYPNNIRLLKESKNEYLIYSTNYINPLFLFVSVGSLYLKNIKLCIIIYICHFLSNIIMLYLLRNNNIKNNNSNSINKKIYYDSIVNTIKSLSIIFANLLLISLLISIIKVIIKNNYISTLIIGVVEFSRGIYEISFLNISNNLKGLFVLIIITFGSLSIHFQSISFNNKIKYIKYLKYRLLNVLISILLYIFFILLM